MKSTRKETPFFAAFPWAKNAVRAAAAAQRALAEHGWPDDAEPRVRVGIHTGEAAVTDDDDGEPTARLHLAFQAPDRDTVDAFYEATVAAGGRENGAPESAVITPATTPPTSSTPTAATSKPCTTAVRRGPSSPSSSHPRWIEAAAEACGGPP
jgi:hypothetical protein